jgi:hypothetical protein
MNKNKQKPQRGVTYECYMGFSGQILDTRARRGRRYYFSADSFHGYYYMYPISGRGHAVMVPKERFESHFVPVNPID